MVHRGSNLNFILILYHYANVTKLYGKPSLFWLRICLNIAPLYTMFEIYRNSSSTIKESKINQHN